MLSLNTWVLAGEMLGCALPAKLEQCIFLTGLVPLIESPGNGNSNILSEELLLYSWKCEQRIGCTTHTRCTGHVCRYLPSYRFFRLFGILLRTSDTFTHGDLSLSGKDWEILALISGIQPLCRKSTWQILTCCAS